MVTTTINSSYEEKRKQRIAENKKKIEQLNLHKLSQSLKPTINKHNIKVKMIKVNPGDFGVDFPLRRSSRMADKPTSNKKLTLEFLRGDKRTYKNIMGRNLFYHVNTSFDDRVNALERAEKLELRLGFEFPTFVKPMLHSHIQGSVLNLPKPFCKTYLQKHDELQMLTLIDENEKECQIKYLPEYKGLGSGWRAFCIDHELVYGDAVVFQLIKADAFKVYINRVNFSEEHKEQGESETHRNSVSILM